MKSPIRRILETKAKDLQSLDVLESRSFLTALRQLEAELQGGLAAWLSQTPDGAKPVTRRAVRKALRVIDKFTDRSTGLQGVTAGALKSVKAQAQVMAVGHVKMMGMINLDIPQLNLDVSGILTRSDSLLAARHASSAKRYPIDTRNWIGRQLSVATLRKESFNDMSRRVIKLAGPVPVNTFTGLDASVPAKMARALMANPKANAMRLIRTEAIYAYNKVATLATQDLEKTDPGWVKKWDATADIIGGRTCEECRRLDGIEVKPDENFDTGVPHPPLHPNCRCAVTQWRPEWNEEYDD